jgi:hypothetical protein
VHKRFPAVTLCTRHPRIHRCIETNLTRKLHPQLMPKLATLTLLGTVQVRKVELRTLQQIRGLVPVSRLVMRAAWSPGIDIAIAITITLTTVMQTSSLCASHDFKIFFSLWMKCTQATPNSNFAWAFYGKVQIKKGEKLPNGGLHRKTYALVAVSFATHCAYTYMHIYIHTHGCNTLLLLCCRRLLHLLYNIG